MKGMTSNRKFVVLHGYYGLKTHSLAQQSLMVGSATEFSKRGIL